MSNQKLFDLIDESEFNLYAKKLYDDWEVQFVIDNLCVIKLWVRSDGDYDTEYYFHKDTVWTRPYNMDHEQPQGYVQDENFNIAWESDQDEKTLDECKKFLGESILYYQQKMDDLAERLMERV